MQLLKGEEESEGEAVDQNNHNTALEFMSGSGQAQQPAHENNNVQSNGLFGTNDPITREQLATMLRC